MAAGEAPRYLVIPPNTHHHAPQAIQTPPSIMFQVENDGGKSPTTCGATMWSYLCAAGHLLPHTMPSAIVHLPAEYDQATRGLRERGAAARVATPPVFAIRQPSAVHHNDVPPPWWHDRLATKIPAHKITTQCAFSLQYAQQFAYMRNRPPWCW